MSSLCFKPRPRTSIQNSYISQIKPKDVELVELKYILPSTRKVTATLGLIDVNLIRTAIVPNAVDLENDNLIEDLVTRQLEDVYELVKSRAQSFGANCVMAFKVDISKM